MVFRTRTGQRLYPRRILALPFFESFIQFILVAHSEVQCERIRTWSDELSPGMPSELSWAYR